MDFNRRKSLIDYLLKLAFEFCSTEIICNLAENRIRVKICRICKVSFLNLPTKCTIALKKHFFYTENVLEVCTISMCSFLSTFFHMVELIKTWCEKRKYLFCGCRRQILRSGESFLRLLLKLGTIWRLNSFSLKKR